MTLKETEVLFQYQHLPPQLQAVSEPFHRIAVSFFRTIPDAQGAYRTKALNDLWQAKNWAVAAVAQS